MTDFRTWLALTGTRSFAVGVAVAILITGCCPTRAPSDVPVPESSRRLSYVLEADPTPVIDQAISDAVCLIRSGDVTDCKEDPIPETLCNNRTDAEVRALIAPAFRAIPHIALISPSTINAFVADSIPGAVSTTQVADARRDFLCREWRSADGACVGIKIDSIWILLHSAADSGGIVDWFEVFLAESPCEDIPPGSQS